MVADEDVDRSQATLRLGDGMCAAFRRSEIGDGEREPERGQLVLASRRAHDPGATCRQQLCYRAPDAPACARDERDPALDSCHAPVLRARLGPELVVSADYPLG
jgi:hypothetical protein